MISENNLSSYSLVVEFYTTLGLYQGYRWVGSWLGPPNPPGVAQALGQVAPRSQIGTKGAISLVLWSLPKDFMKCLSSAEPAEGFCEMSQQREVCLAKVFVKLIDM